MYPRKDLTAALCAAMTARTVRECRRRFGDLADRHLLQRPDRGSFGFHDLSLACARHKATALEPAERWEETLDRAFTHMARRAESARQVLAGGSTAPDFEGGSR